MTEALDEEMGLLHCGEEVEVEIDDVPEVTGSEAAFARFMEVARAIPKKEVLAFRGNASLAFHNVERGVKAVMEQREMVMQLPGIDVKRLFELPELALAVVYAAAVAARAAGEVPTSEYRKLLSRANTVRRILLLSLEGCAAAGVVPVEEVKPIRPGKGTLDLAGDVVALVALYRKHADVLKNKTPVTAALLHEASEVGTALLSFVKPKGTPVVKEPRTPQQAEDERDRLWTLLVRGHAELLRVGGFLFGQETPQQVPALQSRLRVVRKPTASA